MDKSFRECLSRTLNFLVWGKGDHRSVQSQMYREFMSEQKTMLTTINLIKTLKKSRYSNVNNTTHIYQVQRHKLDKLERQCLHSTALLTVSEGEV